MFVTQERLFSFLKKLRFEKQNLYELKLRI